MKRLMAALLLLSAAGAAVQPPGEASLSGAHQHTGDPSAPHRTMVTEVHSAFFSRLRVPIAFAILSLSNRNRFAKEAFEYAPLAPGEIQTQRLAEKRNLIVERVRFWSNQMDQPRYFIALVPKIRPKAAFILNHGWFDRPEYLLTYLRTDDVYSAMLARGEVLPAVVIIPDVRFPSFRRLRSDRYPFPDYLPLVADEIYGLASQRYAIPRERDRWAIGGFSFGGYLSLDVGRRYPGRFASVSVVSGMFDPRWTFWPSHSDAEWKSAADGIRNMQVIAGPIPDLFLACGTNDWLFSTMRTLHLRLDAMEVSHQWQTGRGGHTWVYWSSMLPRMLAFHLGGEGRHEIPASPSAAPSVDLVAASRAID